MPSWQAPVPTPSYRLAISPVGNYRLFSVCGFISPAYLEYNSLKDPLNEGQVSRNVRHFRLPSVPPSGDRGFPVPGKLSSVLVLK